MTAKISVLLSNSVSLVKHCNCTYYCSAVTCLLAHRTTRCLGDSVRREGSWGDFL